MWRNEQLFLILKEWSYFTLVELFKIVAVIVRQKVQKDSTSVTDGVLHKVSVKSQDNGLFIVVCTANSEIDGGVLSFAMLKNSMS